VHIHVSPSVNFYLLLPFLKSDTTKIKVSRGPLMLWRLCALLAFFKSAILDLQRANQRFVKTRAEQFGDSRGQEAGRVRGGFVGVGGAVAR